MKRSFVVGGIGAAMLAACVSYSDAPAGIATPDAGTKTTKTAGGDAAASGGPGGGNDAGIFDAAPDVAAPGTANMLLNPDFENGCDNLIPTSNATVTVSSDAHSGMHSCEVCALGTTEGYAYLEVAQRVAVGTSYFGQIWYKAPADAPPFPTLELQAGMDTNQATEATDDNGPINKEVPPSGTWQQGSTIYTVTKPDGVDLWFAIEFDNGAESHCVLVDDAELEPQN